MVTQKMAEVRASRRAEFNAFLADCPTRHVLATIGDKWSALVITALADGPRRHSELMRAIAGASQKMLTQTLRSLERDGLVVRSVTASVPPRVDYELTALGVTLVPIVSALKAWAEENILEILHARESYDEKRAVPGA